MKEEVKNLWVEALRSGKYQQGKRELRNLNDQYCCLGVLCEISGLGKWMTTMPRGYIVKGTVPNKAYPPEEVWKWAGMRTSDGRYLDGDRWTAVDEQNDLGKTFHEIANIIEEHWEAL